MSILENINYSLNKIKEKLNQFTCPQKLTDFLERHRDDSDLSTLLEILKKMSYDDIKGKRA